MKRRTMIIPGLTWFGMIVLAIVYNSIVINNADMLHAYIINAVSLFILGCAAIALTRIYGTKLKDVKIQPAVYIGYLVVVSLGLYAFKNIIPITIINGAAILLLYPLSFCVLKNMFNKKYGVIIAVIIGIALSAEMLVVCGAKMMVFTAGIFLIAEVIGICIFKMNLKRWWLLQIAILLLGLIFSTSYIVTTKPYVMEYFMGFLNPRAYEVYTPIVDIVTDCKWFSFDIASIGKFYASNIYSCTYAQLAACFGMAPTLLLIIIQIVSLTIMTINAYRFKNPTRRFMGIIAAFVIGLHLLFSTSSSFLRMPLTSYGAPFLTDVGLEYCILPLIMYVYLYMMNVYEGKRIVR